MPDRTPDEPAFRTPISSHDLAAHLAGPDWVVVDCRFDLTATVRGEEAYLEAHIPAAVYAHLERDLSGPRTGRDGRHPLPEPDRLADTFGRWGIAPGVQVVAYDQDSGMYASRLWWLLRFLGHERVAVLDGGFRKWLAEGRPTRGGREMPRERAFAAAPQGGWVADAEEVGRHAGEPSRRLLDARAPERFRGDSEPLDPVAGHVPGARNHFFGRSLDRDATFLPSASLRSALTASLDGVPPDRAIVYCGSGVTACHVLLALEHAGLPGARLYPGSWSEWCSDPTRPVERGEHADEG